MDMARLEGLQTMHYCAGGVTSGVTSDFSFRIAKVPCQSLIQGDNSLASAISRATGACRQ